MTPCAIAVHGGAGTIAATELDSARARDYRAALERAVRAGHDVLHAAGSALDAVTAAVVILEDDPLFNAGYGAVFNAEGEHELDASIMNGANLKAGAVAGLKRVKNPVLAARAVMDKTPHVMLAAEGAEAFAEAQGLEMVSPAYFYTEARWNALKRIQERLGSGGAGDAERHGTVGAVARDARGDLAAATSTGGFTNKMVGRVGDSAIIGAGTYADNETCAVSCTGDGEYFIRAGVAREVAARMRYLGEALASAADFVIREIARLGGSGGLIAIARSGEIALPFNTQGMYRASIGSDGALRIAIHRAPLPDV